MIFSQARAERVSSVSGKTALALPNPSWCTNSAGGRFCCGDHDIHGVSCQSWCVHQVAECCIFGVVRYRYGLSTDFGDGSLVDVPDTDESSCIRKSSR